MSSAIARATAWRCERRRSAMRCWDGSSPAPGGHQSRDSSWAAKGGESASDDALAGDRRDGGHAWAHLTQCAPKVIGRRVQGDVRAVLGWCQAVHTAGVEQHIGSKAKDLVCGWQIAGVTSAWRTQYLALFYAISFFLAAPWAGIDGGEGHAAPLPLPHAGGDSTPTNPKAIHHHHLPTYTPLSVSLNSQLSKASSQTLLRHIH